MERGEKVTRIRLIETRDRHIYIVRETDRAAYREKQKR